jgi:hypothetical protein
VSTCSWVRKLFGRPAAGPSREALEDRLAPATCVVSTPADSGTGSLRQAPARHQQQTGDSMHTRRRFGRVALGVAAALLLGGAAPARADLVISNFGNPGSGFFSGFGSGAVAATSFTTDAAGGVLMSATLSLFSQIAPSPATFALRLYDDNGDKPGSVIATFTNMPSTSSQSAASLTFLTDTPLAPDTTYWLGVTATDPTFGGWSQVTGPSTGPWTIGGLNFSFDGGKTWDSTDHARANVFSLDATIPAAVPEPASLTLLATGALVLLGYGWRRRRPVA